MNINKTKFDDVFKIVSEPFHDNRGFLVRTFDKSIFNGVGLQAKWVQESQSHTLKKYTLRGLHLSLPPHEECKLITPIKGIMQWIVVDLRNKSKFFGKWASFNLSSEKHESLYVSRGFAHGCLSLTDYCDLMIMSDNYYSQNSGTGILWCDNELKINWSLNGIIPIISERDKHYSTFKEFKQQYGRT